MYNSQLAGDVYFPTHPPRNYRRLEFLNLPASLPKKMKTCWRSDSSCCGRPWMQIMIILVSCKFCAPLTIAQIV